MGRRKTPGLFKRGKVWHIDKLILGKRIAKSTGTTLLAEAELFLARQTEEVRQAQVYGVRPKHTFREAAEKFLRENQHKRSIHSDKQRLVNLDPWIGHIQIDQIHMDILGPWKEHRKREGVKAGTINHGLKVVRRILNLAEKEWHDEYGMTWLDRAPRIKLLPDKNKRKPYPLNWEEQERLFKKLPSHLKEMAIFAVNTGCRDAEVCNLRWDWMVDVPELDTSVFLIPDGLVKNQEERLVVLNRIALAVVQRQRGKHETHVFAYRNNPIKRMLNSSWCRVRKLVGLPQVRVHDLKHTFGRRLRAAGVSFEDRQDLLGHKSGRITTHYSAAELSQLIGATNKVCKKNGAQPELVVLRRISVS